MDCRRSWLSARRSLENGWRVNVHLDEIVDWIDRAFGSDEVIMEQEDKHPDLHLLRSLIGESAYQRHLRDQVNRQIIRDYLTNAVVLGIISEGGLAAFASTIATEEGRSTLALYMLMSSVEDAADLPVNAEAEPLRPLEPEPVGDRSHIKLVPR